MAFRIFEKAKVELHQSQMQHEVRIVRPQRDGLLVRLDRLFQPTAFGEDDSQFMVRRREFGILGHRLAKTRRRFLGASGSLQGKAQIVQDLRLVGHQQVRLAIAFGGFVET